VSPRGGGSLCFVIELLPCIEYIRGGREEERKRFAAGVIQEGSRVECL